MGTKSVTYILVWSQFEAEAVGADLIGAVSLGRLRRLTKRRVVLALEGRSEGVQRRVREAASEAEVFLTCEVPVHFHL